MTLAQQHHPTGAGFLPGMMDAGALAPRLRREGGSVTQGAQITTAKQAANDELVLAFGWLQGSANRLEYVLGRAIEQECGISHLMFEVLLILGRAGGSGLSMRAVAQERVLTTGGVTRLVDRMVASGLVARDHDPDDRRGRLVRLTPLGEETAVRAARLHAENVQRLFLDLLPADHREQFISDLRTVSRAARDAMPRLR
jgi:DNA-binding MarR family transcriptional regulator